MRFLRIALPARRFRLFFDERDFFPVGKLFATSYFIVTVDFIAGPPLYKLSRIKDQLRVS